MKGRNGHQINKRFLQLLQLSHRGDTYKDKWLNVEIKVNYFPKKAMGNLKLIWKNLIGNCLHSSSNYMENYAKQLFSNLWMHT
jgi:hypothetical protein